jgi:uroporphyrinogen decarboxylase
MTVSMSSREIVQRAIHFRGPPRLPVNFGCFGVTDFAWVPRPNRPEEEARWAADRIDIWGCRWERTEVANMGQVKGHPLGGPDDLGNLRVPDFTDDCRFAGVDEVLRKAESEGRYVTSGIFMVLVERLESLLGFEDLFAGLLDEEQRPALARLADLVTDAHVALVRETARRFPGRVQGWGMSDDWGTQQAAFVSLELWMEFFYPRYKRIFDAMHAAGCDVWVHSCGKINAIIEGYIRAGVNVVNVQQPRCLGIEEIGRRYRGRIAFETLADIQHTLPTGNTAAIEADAEAIGKHWADKRGGLVFSDYGDGQAIGVPDLAPKRLMYQAFSRLSERLYGNPLPEPGA